MNKMAQVSKKHPSKNVSDHQQQQESHTSSSQDISIKEGLPVGFFDNAKIDASFHGLTDKQLKQQAIQREKEEKEQQQARDRDIQTMLEQDSYRFSLEQAHKQEFVLSPFFTLSIGTYNSCVK